MQVYNRGRKRGLTGFSADAMAALKTYAWPGNVRELENLVQRLAILHADGLVRAADLPEKYREGLNLEELAEEQVAEAVTTSEAAALSGRGEGGSIPEPLEDQADFNALVSDFEDRLILQALSRTGGNKKEAAALLNLKRTTLLEKIKKKQLDSLFSRLVRKTE